MKSKNNKNSQEGCVYWNKKRDCTFEKSVGHLMYPTATASFGTFSGRSCQESQLGFNLLAELWRGEAAIAEAEADEGPVLAHRHLFRPPAARSVGH